MDAPRKEKTCTMERYSFGGDIPVGIYDGFSVKVS